MKSVAMVRAVLRAEVLIAVGFFAGCVFGGFGYGLYAGLVGLNFCGG